MPTPSIQTLVTDAQQILNLDSISAVRSVVAVALANANTGTPLNPNLTTQQLWNEFYQVVNKPKSDIESIIANQLMKFLFAPPAPGGAGANGQVIFNDNGVLAGDPQFLWNKTTNLLTVTGSATITGDLTVRTTRLTTTTTGVGIGTATPILPLDVRGTAGAGALFLRTTDPAAPVASAYIQTPVSTGFSSTVPIYGFWYQNSGMGNPASDTLNWIIASGEAMRLNSTGLGVGGSPTSKLTIFAGADGDVGFFRGGSTRQLQLGTSATAGYLNVDNASAGFELRVNGTARVYTDVSGNVGVGRSPSYRFQASSGTKATTASLASVAAFTTTDSDDFGIFFRIKTDATAANRYASITAFDNGSGNGPRDLVLQDLGGNVISTLTATAPTLGVNSQMVFNLTSNTNLRISVRGTDGTTRVANITLA
jgi:hypothetical protein